MGCHLFTMTPWVSGGLSSTTGMISRALQWKCSLLDLPKQPIVSRTFLFPGISMGPPLDSVSCYWGIWGPDKKASAVALHWTLKSSSSGNRLWCRDLSAGHVFGCVLVGSQHVWRSEGSRIGKRGRSDLDAIVAEASAYPSVSPRARLVLPRLPLNWSKETWPLYLCINQSLDIGCPWERV